VSSIKRSGDNILISSRPFVHGETTSRTADGERKELALEFLTSEDRNCILSDRTVLTKRGFCFERLKPPWISYTVISGSKLGILNSGSFNRRGRKWNAYRLSLRW